ncbi:Hypothetical predicted protein [Paramuricea clavata]|uniref:Uncharacterized protein n=1 Tax=Paramuricea clavata TaxID=317549 RepID=A0A6S7I818_PARCT|nr:Hypothetical predicted protein [Paramuricea clavata]
MKEADRSSIFKPKNGGKRAKLSREVTSDCSNAIYVGNDGPIDFRPYALWSAGANQTFKRGHGISTYIGRCDVNKALPKLYKFITGSKSVTPLGAESHILKFKHGCPAQCKYRPTAATCDPSIRFPIHYSDSNDLEQAMDTTLEEYFGFGFV